MLMGVIFLVSIFLYFIGFFYIQSSLFSTLVIGGGYIYHILNKRIFFSPTSAVFIGWVLPSVIAFYPLHEIAVLTGPVSITAHQVALTLSILNLILLVRFDYNWRECIAVDFRSSNVYRIVSIGLFLVSFAGYSLALIGSGFQFPFFQNEISKAAEDFFRTVPFSGLLYSFGEIAAVIAVAILLGRKSIFRCFKDLLFWFLVAYIVLSFLSGKRMALILFLISGISMLMLLRPGLVTLKRAGFFGVILITFFIINAYYRALYGFENYYDGLDLVYVDNVYEFTLLQFILYIQPNFYNLSLVIESGDFELGLNSLFYFLSDSSGSTYDLVRDRTYNMTTFLAPLVQDFGVYISVILGVLFTAGLLFLKRVSYNSIFLMTLYCLLVSRFSLLFTGDLFFNNLFIFKVLLCLLLFTFLEAKNGKS